MLAMLAVSLLAPSKVYGDVLLDLRNCESGGDYTTNTGNGYYGAYQFSLGTWQAMGGDGYPHEATPEEQDYRAWLLMTRYGLYHWPVCGLLISED